MVHAVLVVRHVYCDVRNPFPFCNIYLFSMCKSYYDYHILFTVDVVCSGTHMLQRAVRMKCILWLYYVFMSFN